MSNLEEFPSHHSLKTIKTRHHDAFLKDKNTKLYKLMDDMENVYYNIKINVVAERRR